MGIWEEFCGKKRDLRVFRAPDFISGQKNVNFSLFWPQFVVPPSRPLVAQWCRGLILFSQPMLFLCPGFFRSRARANIDRHCRHVLIIARDQPINRKHTHLKCPNFGPFLSKFRKCLGIACLFRPPSSPIPFGPCIPKINIPFCSRHTLWQKPLAWTFFQCELGAKLPMPLQ